MASIQKRILQNGTVRWLAQIRKKGYSVVNVTRQTKAAADKEARRIELAMENGTWDEFAAEEQKKNNTPLEYFIKKYLSEITPHKAGGEKGIINETSVLNQVLRTPLGKMNIYHIKTGHVIELRNKWRDKGNSPTTINRKLTTLHDVFKHIQTTWKHESLSNPVSGAKISLKKSGSKAKARSRTLTEDELIKMRSALDGCKSPYMRWAFDLALETAGRRKELIENTWDNVSSDITWLRIPEQLSKTRVERFIPLTPAAKSILISIKDNQLDSPSKLLFPITKKSFEEAWKKAYKRANIVNFQFRDTRHIATTMLSNIYPKMQDLAKITGHEKLETLLGYYEEDIRDQVARMNSFYTKKSN